MNNGSDWQSQFSSGFTSSGSPVDLSGFFWFLLAVGVLAALWYFYDRYNRSRPTTRKSVRATAKFASVPGKFNPLQQIRIQEMIDAFRKQEPSAQSVPSAVLEKFGELVYHQSGKLRTTEKDVEAFVGQNFPLRSGDHIELDFHTSGSLHLIKAKVSSITTKNVLVDFEGMVPDFLRTGTPIHINYSSGRHFLQGTTQILEVRPDVGLMLKKPTQVMLTSERRYSRLPLAKANGTLQDTKSDYHAPIKVLDLSLEGVRVQVGRPLDKSHLYLLSFETEALGRSWQFGPLECVPSKAFMTGSGTHESGLVFLSLTMAIRQKLVTYMKTLAQQLQAERQAEEERSRSEAD